MNHHLRFVSPAVCTAGAALFLTSCSSTKVEPLVANPKHEITYEVRIFDVSPEEAPNEGLGILSAEGGAVFISNMKRQASFHGTMSGQLGEKKTLSNKKDFVYPTAYDPPQISKAGQSGVFPVTPAQPRDFVTTQIGTTVSLTGSKISNDIFEIRTQLDRKVLLGFVNYGTPITSDATDWLGRHVDIVITENKIEQPRFSSHRKNTSITLGKDQYLVITSPGIKPPTQEQFPFTEKRPPGFIALIRAVHR